MVDRVPRATVPLVEAERRIYGDVAGTPLGFTAILSDGRILAVAEDEPTDGGEGVAYLLEP